MNNLVFSVYKYMEDMRIEDHRELGSWVFRSDGLTGAEMRAINLLYSHSWLVPRSEFIPYTSGSKTYIDLSSI